jgi:hypothetical protein
MSQDPDPAEAKGRVCISYDYKGVTFPVTLTVTLQPSGPYLSHLVESKDDLPWCFDLPAGTESGYIEDGSAQSLLFYLSIIS